MSKIIRFGVPLGSILCPLCKHRTSMALNDSGQYMCAAFPGGIPRKIADGDFDHRKAYIDDNGIQFEIRDDLDLSDWIEEINDAYKYADDST